MTKATWTVLSHTIVYCVSCTMVYNVVLIQCGFKVVFESVNETLVGDHSEESYWAVLPRGTVYYAAQVGFNF